MQTCNEIFENDVSIYEDLKNQIRLLNGIKLQLIKEMKIDDEYDGIDLEHLILNVKKFKQQHNDDKDKSIVNNNVTKSIQYYNDIIEISNVMITSLNNFEFD